MQIRGGVFCNLAVICLALFLTRTWKLREGFIAVMMYRSQQRSRRGQRIVASQSQEVTYCLLKFTRRGSFHLSTRFLAL